MHTGANSGDICHKVKIFKFDIEQVLRSGGCGLQGPLCGVLFRDLRREIQSMSVN